MRLAFLTFTALAVLGLAAGHLASLDNAALVDSLIRIFS